ncbi:MAG: archease [Chloroflexi bacterium]|nr:archease [Chloroflexota bacterium]
MKKYRPIEHTADIGLVAYGRDLGECFSNAAWGLFSCITDLRRVRPEEVREVRVEAGDTEALLVDWLNELLFLFDSEGFLGRRFDVVEIGDGRLRARVWGERLDPERHRTRIAVKATTYHQLQVVQRDGWRARVIFDV